MAFTPIAITATFERPDGQPAQGKLTAILSAPMQNGTTIIDPTPVYGVLNGAGVLESASGGLPFLLEANDDPGTTPANPTASYEFVLELDVTAPAPFSAVISHLAAGGTVDLSALY